MGTQRAHITLPTELIAKIDAQIGPRGRSAFLTRLAEQELRRLRLIALLEESERDPIWKDEDHPELAEGSEAWVRKLRAGSRKRLTAADARRKA